MLTLNSEVEMNKLNTVPTLKFTMGLGLDNQDDTYIFDIVANSDSQLAASYSDNTISLIESKHLHVNYSWKAHKKKISALKFSPINQHHLFSSSLDGCISLWDLRYSVEEPALKFQDISATNKPITCFDVDFSGSYICSGTELMQQNSYILFW
ncbi:ribosome biogenesis protein WDR12 homolog [Centruroides sculpturatus]|uniref:ribosome biogenesis protein WDR12 homolog n=1 Tax=Centruroides sculpturatus TaxID=218467 RepID=UPI000C6CF7BE|nr:ribosome biogenesis protein WDR12 homolog [Centruroides sculpturatus]